MTIAETLTQKVSQLPVGRQLEVPIHHSDSIGFFKRQDCGGR